MDTTLPSRTWTTSVADELPLMAMSTEIAGDARLRYSVLAAIVLSVLISSLVTRWMILRPQNLISLGFVAQKIQMQGHDIQAYIPIYMKEADYQALHKEKS